jgi:hypothetical protein
MSSCLSLLLLLLESLKQAKKQWERTHAALASVSGKGHQDYQKRLERWEKRRGEESRTEHARRLAGSADVDQQFYDQAANKRKGELARLTALEKKHREAYDKAGTKRRRKQMLKAPVPSLDEPRPSITTPRLPAPTVARTIKARRTAKLTRPRG